ncbi:hypothetical protein ACA910_000946 [Epithemia clementina (nom. ined.)]
MMEAEGESSSAASTLPAAAATTTTTVHTAGETGSAPDPDGQKGSKASVTKAAMDVEGGGGGGDHIGSSGEDDFVGNGDNDDDDDQQLMSLISAVRAKKDPQQDFIPPKMWSKSRRILYSVLVSVAIIVAATFLVRSLANNQKGSGSEILDKKQQNGKHASSSSSSSAANSHHHGEISNHHNNDQPLSRPGGTTTYINPEDLSTSSSHSSHSADHSPLQDDNNSPNQPPPPPSSSEKNHYATTPTTTEQTSHATTEHTTASPEEEQHTTSPPPPQEHTQASPPPEQNTIPSPDGDGNNHHAPVDEDNGQTFPNKNGSPTFPGQSSTSSNAQQQSAPPSYPNFPCPPLTVSPYEDHYLLSKDRVMNETAFLQRYRSSSFDREDATFDEYKQEVYSWKTRRFAEHLASGDTIFESASGLGLNLVMTLQILAETKDISNVVVYGNDYVVESVVSANRLMNLGILPAGGAKGVICQGDSSDLSWVPSNSFDLVFTGELMPLQDPLGLDLEEEDLWWKYKSICKQRNDHQTSMVEKMKKMQEDWFAEWVGEMIRIAKPGVPVIIEQVSQSVCTYWDDWGGVDKDYWSQAIEDYDWDVDASSLEIEDAIGSQEGRYHVFMRKNE